MSRAIEVQSIGKRYRIGGVKEVGYRTLRDSISSIFSRTSGGARQTIDALMDVSFTAEEGEVVGIIGRNGAGKSTLLKILSRITEPTSGRARLLGRVGSLLEVGTGFHPELTGRENIFLNGAILGMRRREIARKFEEIVEFAEVARFIDTPVKRYSSGMYVRLAFAVAAHLNDDILIVDEVLAVGDARFQRKCLSKMEEVGRQGRTILFVSHILSSVTRLCSRAILLENGRLEMDGGAHEVVRRYLRSDSGTTAERRWRRDNAPGNAFVRLHRIAVETEDGRSAERLDIRFPAVVSVEWEVLSAGRVLVPTLHFLNEQGAVVFVTQDLDPEWRRKQRPPGRYISRVSVPGNFLSEGTFSVSLSVNTTETGETHVAQNEVVTFDVIDSFGGDTARGDYGGEMPGVVRPLLPWRNELVSHVDEADR